MENGGRYNYAMRRNQQGMSLKNVDFGTEGATTFEALLCGGKEEGIIEICLDAVDAEAAGTLAIPVGDGESFAKQTCKLAKTITGVHDVYFVFIGSGYAWDNWQFS